MSIKTLVINQINNLTQDNTTLDELKTLTNKLKLVKFYNPLARAPLQKKINDVQDILVTRFEAEKSKYQMVDYVFSV